MPQHIANAHYPRRIHGKRRGHKAAYLEPAQLDCKHADENRRQEERGQAYAHHGKHRNGIVDDAVLVSCRLYAERNGYYELQYRCDKRNRERNAHILENNVLNGFFVFERHSQIALENVEKPFEVSAEYAARFVPEARLAVFDGGGESRAVFRHDKVSALVYRVSTAFKKRKYFVDGYDGIVFGFLVVFGSILFPFDRHAFAFHAVNVVSEVLVKVKTQFSAVVRTLVPLGAGQDTLVRGGGIFSADDFFVIVFSGVFGKLFAREITAFALNLDGKKSVGHGKPVKLLDAVYVLLLHGALGKRRRILIVDEVRGHGARKGINNDRHAE